jgi:aminoglycoside 6'-N-acetyltransferase I
MIEIREFQKEDINQCSDLFLKVFTREPWNDQWESFESAQEYLTEFIVNPSFSGFIASENGRIIGVCFGHKRSYWQGREFEIDEMYVDTDAQGKGVGTKLICYAKGQLDKQGIKNFVLMTGKDLPAEKFYIKNGFYRNESMILMNCKEE